MNHNWHFATDMDDFKNKMEWVPGVRRVEPTPNREIEFNPGDRVTMEYAVPAPRSEYGLPGEGHIDPHTGTVVAAYPPGNYWTNMGDKSDYGHGTGNGFPQSFEVPSYNVLWDLGTNNDFSKYHEPGEVGEKIPQHRLWPEGHINTYNALVDPNKAPDVPPEWLGKVATPSHQLNWTPGEWGKGLISDGNVHTWNTGTSDGKPTHPEYAEQMLGLPTRKWLFDQAYDSAFQIHPTGRVSFYEPTENMQDLISLADPRLDTGAHGSDDWDFMTGTGHYNRWTGERCNCPWNDRHAKLRKLAGPNLNKVLNAPDKALHTMEGEEFKRIMAEQLGEEHESLAPYLAHRFKKGDIRVGGDRDLARGSVGGPHLQFWQHHTPLETFRDTHRKNEEAEQASMGETEQHEEEFNEKQPPGEEFRLKPLTLTRRYTPQLLASTEDRYFTPLADHVLANWNNWYEARQHPLRQGVNVLEGAWTPQKMQERARLHSEEVRRDQEAEEFSHSGQVVHKFPPVHGGEVKGIDWDSVRENEPGTYQRGVYEEPSERARELMGLEKEQNEGAEIASPHNIQELQSLREMYPMTSRPRKSGWHIKQLQSAEDLRAEGTMMGHCIGNDEKYGNCLENGLIDAYSLRDPKGRPHVTWHYNSDGSLAEMFGPNDDNVKPEYQDMLNEWGAQENRDADRGEAVGHQEEDPEEDRELPYVEFPSAGDMNEYTQYHHPDGRYMEVEHEDEEGREPGENTEYSWQEPEWESVAPDYADSYKRVYHAPEGVGPEHIRLEQERVDRGFNQQQKEFFESIKHQGHQSEMQEALQNHINESYGENGELMEGGEKPDNDHVRNVQSWNEAFPSWEVNIPQALPEEGYLGPYRHEPPAPGVVWPHTPHLYDPDSTWKIGPGNSLPVPGVEDQQQLFSAWTFPKTADKLHDFLMNPKSRPDLQTPEGQRWLKMLHYYQEAVGDKIDPLTPWLTREWKKGRIKHSDDGEVGHPYIMKLHPDQENFPGSHERFPLSRPGLSHAADFMQSNHPLRREMGDIMQHDVHGFMDRINAWDQDMKDKAGEEEADQAAKGGEVVHKYPVDWTVRSLHTPEELKAEGSAMGHCVGGYGYADQVRNGDTMIYSLRDEKGHPHATWEIKPEKYEWTDGSGKPHRGYNRMSDDNGYLDHPVPHNGEVVQIQGKEDTVPIEPYQKRIRQWFETFPEEERPHSVAEDDYINDPTDIEDWHHHPNELDEYGIRHAPVTVDWDSMMDRVLPTGGSYRYKPEGYADELYDLAKARGEIPELANEWEKYQDKQRQSMDDAMDQNYDYLNQYAGPHPEMREKPELDEYGETIPAHHELPPEERQKEMEEYEKREREVYDELESQHEGMQAANQLGRLLAPHHVEWKKPGGEQLMAEWRNEPQRNTEEFS